MKRNNRVGLQYRIARDIISPDVPSISLGVLQLNPYRKFASDLDLHEIHHLQAVVVLEYRIRLLFMNTFALRSAALTKWMMTL